MADTYDGQVGGEADAADAAAEVADIIGPIPGIDQRIGAARAEIARGEGIPSTSCDDSTAEVASAPEVIPSSDR